MTATAKKYKLTGPSNDAAWIRQRALDNARRELSAMDSEIEHYSNEFTRPQLRAMRVTMASLRALIMTLEK